MALQNKKLKQGQFTSPQNGDLIIDRYIIENVVDLGAFAKAFPRIKESPFRMYENFAKILLEGSVIVATDPHPMHGLPTYCLESKPTDSPHPSNIYRYAN